MPGIEVGGAGVNVNPQNIKNSDAYKFRLDQGMQAIQRRAGANGTLLTGGTLADLTEFGQGLASTEYDKEFQRQFGLSELNANIQGGNANRNLSGLNTLYNTGYGAAVNMGGMYGNQGQAGAAGTVAGANAINQAAGTIGTTLAEYLARQRAARGGYGQQAVADVAGQAYPNSGGVPTAPSSGAYG